MGMVVLVADAAKITRELMAATLIREGLEVFEARDSNDMLRACEELQPALLICNAMLLGADAAACCKRARAVARDMRIVLLVGVGEVDAATAELGCDAALPRPFRFPAIRELLCRFALLVKRDTPGASFETSYSVPVPSPTAFDIKIIAAPEPPAPSSADPDAKIAPAPRELATPTLDTATLPIPIPAPPSDTELCPEEVLLSEEPEAPVNDAPPRAAALPENLDVEGSLLQAPLPRIVFELYAATFSGKLRLDRLGATRTVYFWGGLPARVDSTQLEDALGRLLLEHGRIVQEQYEAALEFMTTSRCDEASALLAKGCIGKSELLDILREQTEQRLVNAFAWRDGSYSIEPDQKFGESMILTEVHPLGCIWRGVSEHYDLVSLLTYFSSLRERFVVGTGLFELHFERLGPFLRDLDIAAMLDGRTTFEAALRSDDARAREVAQALYVLLVTDMIRASPTPGEPTLLASTQDSEPAFGEAVDYRVITRVCDEINHEYLRIKGRDHFAVLRKDREASAENIDAAYAELSRPFALEALPRGLPEDAERRAAEICSILARARHVLRNPELKARYLEELAQQPVEPVPGDVTRPANAEQEHETALLAERAYADALRLYNSCDFEMATQKLAVALRLNPQEASYHVALARITLARAPGEDAHQQATDILQRAVALDPSHVEANFELAKLLVAAERYLLARPHIMRVLQRAPEHGEARALLSKLAN